MTQSLPSPPILPSRAVSALRLPALDGLRGLAAVAVLCFHVLNTTVPDIGHRSWPLLIRLPLASMGALGVSCFFALSAFLLAQPFLHWLLGDASRPSLRRYAMHRALRILPAWWLLLGLMSVGSAQWLLGQPLELVSFVTLTQNYLGLGHSVVPHGWTLVV